MLHKWYMGAMLMAPLLAGAVAVQPAALNRPALQVAHPASSNLQAIANAGARMVAGGERGLIIYSDDAGQHWRQAQVPVSVTITALRFASPSNGWAVGNMGVVLKTSDAGATWRRVFDGRQAAQLAEQAAQQAWDAVRPDPDDAGHPLNLLLADARRLVDEGADKPLFDIAVRDDSAVLVVGGYGLAFASSDGGATWQAQMAQLPNPHGATIYGVAVRPGERLLFGEQGFLAHLDGSTFTAAASPTTGSLFGGLALRDGALLLYGLRGKVYRSAAAGAPWTEVATPVDASLLGGVQLADGTVLLLGAAGQIVASRDQGARFTVLPMLTRFPFSGAAVAADGALVIVGARGLLRMPASQLQHALQVATR